MKDKCTALLAMIMSLYFLSVPWVSSAWRFSSTECIPYVEGRQRIYYWLQKAHWTSEGWYPTLPLIKINSRKSQEIVHVWERHFVFFIAYQRKVSCLSDDLTVFLLRGLKGRGVRCLSKDFPLLCDMAHSAERVGDFLRTSQFITPSLGSFRKKRKSRIGNFSLGCLIKKRNHQIFTAEHLVLLSRRINIKEGVDIAHYLWPDSECNNKTLLPYICPQTFPSHKSN